MVRFITQADYAPGSLQPSGASLADIVASAFSARRAAEAQQRAESRQATLDKARIEEAQFQRAQSDIQRQLQLRKAGVEEAQAGAAATSLAQAPRVSGTEAGLPELAPEEAGPAPSELAVPKQFETLAPIVDPQTGKTLMAESRLPLEYKEQKAARQEQEQIAKGDVRRVTEDFRSNLPPAVQGMYPVGSLMSRETADKLVTSFVRPIKPGKTLQALDTKSKQPTFVSQEEIDAEPGRYQPMKTGVNVNVGDGGGSTLTPEGMDVVAEMFAQTGNMPSFGMGKAAADTRQKIINRAAQLHPNLNLAATSAGYQADKASLGVLQKQTDAITAFENTAVKNAKLLEDTLTKIPDMGTKFLNVPLRSLATQLGSQDMARFNTLRQSVANEFARLLSQGGQMSDAARHEADVLLSPDLTAGQLRSALGALREEAANRHAETTAQLQVIRTRAGGGGGATGGAHGGSANDPLGLR